MKHAARTHALVLDTLADPIRVGRHWQFADGTLVPHVGGGDGDDGGPVPVVVPEDLTVVADIGALEDELRAEFDRLLDDGITDVTLMTERAEAIERVAAEGAARAAAEAQTQADIAALAERVRGSAPDDSSGDGAGDGTSPAEGEGDGGDEGGDGGGDGAGAGGDGGAGAAAEPQPVTAGARPAARRQPAARSVARNVARPTVPTGNAPIAITAAAGLNNIETGQTIGLMDIANAMHDKARNLQDKGRAPIATFRRQFAPQFFVKPGMGPEAMIEVLDAVTAASNWQAGDPNGRTALAAAGGWCTPSQNLYDLLELDGATGLLNLPTIGIERGGINVPSYIGVDAADGALWDWSEAQDASTVVAITDLDVATNVATVTSATHLLEIGDLVNINSTNALVNGPRVVASVADATHFTFAVTAPDATNATGSFTRQKGCFRIPCPTWSDVRLAAYGLCIEHGNLTDAAFPELTRRYVSLATNAHQHRMSALNVAKIVSSAHSDTVVTISSDLSDPLGNLLSALSLSIVDYRSQYKIASTVPIEVLFPVWVAELCAISLAMRQGVPLDRITPAQVVAEISAHGATPQFLEDYQPMWSGAAKTTWPTTVSFVFYVRGNFVEGVRPAINLGVMRDSAQVKVNDFTAAWTEEFSLLARRGPKARKVTVTTGVVDGKTGGTPA